MNKNGKTSTRKSGPIFHLPNGRSLVPLTDWLFKIRPYSGEFRLWHEEIFAQKGQYFPIYAWKPATDEPPTALSVNENVAEWQAIFEIFRIEQKEPEAHDDILHEAMIDEIKSDAPRHFVDLRDITDFSKAARFPNPYAEAETKFTFKEELPSKAYLLIGALCDLHWRSKNYSGRIVQDKIIRELEEYGIRGLGERNLKDILPKAIKAFEHAKKLK